MDEEIGRYRQNLLGEIRADAHMGGDYERSRFIDRACQVLETGEEFTEYTLCRAHTPWKRGTIAQVDAFSFSQSDGILSLVVMDYSGADEPDALTTDEVRRLAQAAYLFLEASVHDDIARSWDESHEAHALSREVFAFATGEMTKACIYLVSDRMLGSKLGKLPEFSLGTQKVEIQLWDIARLARVDMSTSGREEIQVNFAEEYGQGIPALSAGLGEDSRYQSYMCVMPGEILASLYDRFGGRILEQNVRAFLGETRKVNKGIRDTLRNDPAMFFAFNNGLTATVSNLSLEQRDDGPPVITAVTDFQVVNGGQTTASLYWAKKANYDLSKVFVQMKLSKLPEEGFEDAVHDIARYANAQNAVSASDLFAGHPYFKRLETLSRQTLAPSAKPGDIGGFWFFERTQGSYNVELKRRKGTAAKAWELIHPKRQKLTKTDIARYEATWESIPHSVCSGAQKNIAAFAKIITQTWSNDPEAFDVAYFKRLVVKAILTKAVDAEIPAQDWYPGSILRQLATYTLSLMSDRMLGAQLQPDFDAVWRAQHAPRSFVAEAMRIAKKILPLLQEIPSEQTKNRLVTEWAKREACWLRVQSSSISLSTEFFETLTTTTTLKKAPVRWGDKAAELWKNGTWARLHEWNKAAEILTPDESDLVERATAVSSFGFKGFRLIKLQEAWKRAVDGGFA
jgi:hypothetical protein